MKLGANIRTLRKNADLSQEQLSERLGVSFQAVSRWERDETYPDITLLPSIANFFEVTVDFLLGTNEDKEADEVEDIVSKCREYDIHYDGEKMCHILENGLKKYPGNFTIMSWYVYAFQRINPNKAIEIGHYVLDKCTDNELRNWVNSSIIYAYKNSENLDRAIELAKKLPSYYQTSQDVLRSCLQGKELLNHVQHMIIDLEYEFWYSIRQIRDNYSASEQIELFKKSNSIYDSIYETDDFPVKLVRKMRNYQGMAEIALSNGDIDNGLSFMKKAAECAIKHDALPESVTSKNILFNVHPYDRSSEASMIICDLLKKDFEHEDEFYKGIRNLPIYIEIIDSL